MTVEIPTAELDVASFMASLDEFVSGPLEQRAPRNDRDGRHMADNFRDLAALGVTKMALPTAVGGLDLPIETQIATLERIASGCGATAFTLSQHLGATASLHRWSSEIGAAANAIEAIVDAGAIACISNSYPSNDTSGATAGMTVERHGGKAHVNGMLGFASGSPFADFLVARGALTGETHQARDRQMVCAVIPMRAHGVNVRDTWEAIGLAGSLTNDIVLDAVELASDAFATIPATEIESFGVSVDEREDADRRLAGATLVWAGTWLGLAEAAFTLARQHAESATNTRPLATQLGGIPQRRAEEPWAQEVLAAMRADIDAYRALIQSSVTRLERPDDGRAQWTTRNFAAAGRTAERVAMNALSVGGAHVYGQRSPLNRVIRDLLAAVALTKHPSANALHGQLLTADG